MRRTYISPEFETKPVYGTYNMAEESNFFGAKMLEIEDSILVTDQNLIYYQKDNGEQIDYNTEVTLDSFVYVASEKKNDNHTLVIDQTQTTYNIENNTKWILDINIKTILYDYIYASLKKYRTFEGLKTEMTINSDVNESIGNYIDLNVMNRYKFSRLDIYLSYVDLRNQNTLRYKNAWNPEIFKDSNKFNKFQTVTQFDGSAVRILFSQEKPSKSFRFDYYFNILFEKI